MIKPTIVVGFLIIMAASLLIGVYHTCFRSSKGIVFALLYSFFLGAALGLNSEVVKSFSIPPYMFAAFLLPAAVNLLVFLRPKVSELGYELQVQWKKILLNAAVMDASFFFLLKAFQLSRSTKGCGRMGSEKFPQASLNLQERVEQPFIDEERALGKNLLCRTRSTSSL